MNIFLYILLLLLPLPLFILIFRDRHHQNCLLPFMALSGIYIFIILGSLVVINDEQLFSVIYYNSILVIIILFYLFYIIIFSSKSALHIHWTPIIYTKADMHIMVPFIVILWAFSFSIFFLYYVRHGLPAVFDVSLSEYVNLYDIRGEKSTSLPEGMHLYTLAFITIPAFIFCYTYVWKRLLPTTKTKAIFCLNLPLVLFFSSLTMHKITFAYLLLYLLLINVFIVDRSFNLKKILWHFALGVGSILVILRIYLINKPLEDFLEFIPFYLFERICVKYTEAHANILQIFPNQHDFFLGKTFGNPGHILPYDPVDLSQFLGVWVSGRTENYSSPSFSQGYANFGIAGFFLMLILMFLQIIILLIVFKKCPKTPLFLSIYLLIVPYMLGYSIQSIDGVISLIFVIFAGVLISIYYFFKNMVRILGASKEQQVP